MTVSVLTSVFRHLQGGEAQLIFLLSTVCIPETGLLLYLAVYTFVPPRVIWVGWRRPGMTLTHHLSCFCGSFWILIKSPIMSPSALEIFFFFLAVLGLHCACRLSCYTTCGLLAPRPRTEPCIGRQTLHYWTPREVPPLLSCSRSFCNVVRLVYLTHTILGFLSRQ